MTTAAISERLYDYIRVADDKKIKAIYTLLESEMPVVSDWSEDEEFVAELDERVRRWEDGTDPGFSVDEVKMYLAEQRKERQTATTK
jgi:hypothetical protein